MRAEEIEEHEESTSGDGLGNLYHPVEVEFDGVYLLTPVKRLMQAVYRSGVLLGIFPIMEDAKKFLDANSSIRMVEDHGFQFRIVPVHATLLINPLEGDQKL